jgi:dTDP-4-dehydrorhamnose reductase
MAVRTIVVFGAGGQVGRALVRARPPPGLEVRGLTRAQVDIVEAQAVRRALADAPGIAAVVNAAAYTDVDRAESERAAAFAANATGPAVLAEACAAAGLPLIHLSSDYVFDGTKTRAYAEDDPPAPLGAYGASKLAGEEAVRARCPRAVVLRTSWVYGPAGRNFVRTMLRLGAERKTLRVVDDQRGSPTSALDIADAVLAISGALAQGKRNGFGTFHFCDSGSTTWYGFACAIFELARARGLPAPETVEPIVTADYPTPAPRPANSVLDCSRLATVYAVAAPPWRESLAACLDEIARAEHGGGG